MGILAVTVLTAGYLAFAPTGDSSYSCVDAPIVRAFNPERDMNDSEFFDAGARCNADADSRVRLSALVVVAGAAATSVAGVGGRRRRKAASQPGTASNPLA